VVIHGRDRKRPTLAWLAVLIDREARLLAGVMSAAPVAVVMMCGGKVGA
jgi:hypothetical protein